MSIRVQLSLAEHFLNWFPFETKLYIRGERGKDRGVVDALDGLGVVRNLTTSEKTG